MICCNSLKYKIFQCHNIKVNIKVPKYILPIL